MAGAGAGTTASACRRRGGPAADRDQVAVETPSPSPAPGAGTPDRRGAATPAAPRRGRPRRYTSEAMLEELRVFFETHGRVPSQVDFNIRRPNTSVYKRRFGSWGDALRAAGLEPVYGRPRRAA